MFNKIIKWLEIILRMTIIGTLLFVYANHFSDNRGIKNRLSLIENLQEYSINYQRDIYKQIANAIAREKELTNNFNNLQEKNLKEFKEIKNYIDRQMIDERIKREMEKIEQKNVEYNILRWTVRIDNNTREVEGSGTTIKYKENYYILSAGHLINSITDKIFLIENDIEICELEVIKVDYLNDLLLLRPKDHNIIPLTYTILGSIEPMYSDKVYVCGNPAGVEDLLSEGRVVKYTKNYMYIQDHCWYGSSGGGVFNLNGELIGVISHLSIANPNPFAIIRDYQPLFVIDGIVRLNRILKFMEGI